MVDLQRLGESVDRAVDEPDVAAATAHRQYAVRTPCGGRDESLRVVVIDVDHRGAV
jgi:hypothetical protein